MEDFLKDFRIYGHKGNLVMVCGPFYYYNFCLKSRIDLKLHIILMSLVVSENKGLKILNPNDVWPKSINDLDL